MSSKLEANSESGLPLITAHFFLSGRDLDTDEITEVLNLEPSDIWRQKRAELRARTDLPTVCWKYGFKKKSFPSTTDAIELILDTVWPLRTRIEAYAATHDVQIGIECSVTISEDRPIYELSATAINRMSDLHCEFLLDVFDYSGDD
jgi:Domain of unknown function (DUF4279)